MRHYIPLYLDPFTDVKCCTFAFPREKTAYWQLYMLKCRTFRNSVIGFVFQYVIRVQNQINQKYSYLRKVYITKWRWCLITYVLGNYLSVICFWWCVFHCQYLSKFGQLIRTLKENDYHLSILANLEELWKRTIIICHPWNCPGEKLWNLQWLDCHVHLINRSNCFIGHLIHLWTFKSYNDSLRT